MIKCLGSLPNHLLGNSKTQALSWRCVRMMKGYLKSEQAHFKLEGKRFRKQLVKSYS